MSQEELLTKRVTEIATPLVTSLALELWGVELGLGPRSMIRIYVESEHGVSIDQCAELSRLVGLSLDVEEIMPAAYTLEVSSPGLERTFFTPNQLGNAVGKTIEVSLHTPSPQFPGRRKFRGTLAQKKNNIFSLLAEDCARPGEEIPVLEFTFDETKKVKQLHDFPEKTQPGKSSGKKNNTANDKRGKRQPAEELVPGEKLRPLTEEEKELLIITGGCEAL